MIQTKSIVWFDTISLAKKKKKPKHHYMPNLGVSLTVQTKFIQIMAKIIKYIKLTFM